jgi:hypothetical protein
MLLQDSQSAKGAGSVLGILSTFMGVFNSYQELMYPDTRLVKYQPLAAERRTLCGDAIFDRITTPGWPETVGWEI